MKRDPRFVDRSRELRQEMPPAELRVWRALRDRRVRGFKFRRQYAIGTYFVDFCCVECKLVVELDGESHLPRRDLDQARDRFIESLGYLILRVWNTDVYENFDGLMERIWSLCERRKSADGRLLPPDRHSPVEGQPPHP